MPVCATVAVLVVTVIVVAEITFRGVTIDLEGSTTVGVEVSPPYVAVMELLPHVSAPAGTVMLAVDEGPATVRVWLPNTDVPA